MKDIYRSGIIQNGLHGYEGHFLLWNHPKWSSIMAMKDISYSGIIQNGLHLGYEGHLSLWNHSKWSSSWL
ncbi:hypothetical protein [Neobacillus sp. 114]|nr:hypothetical protein [Neobacillus sp. 114]